METRLFPAKDRGFFDHGWLVTHHSFSFAGFYHPALMGFGALRVVNDDTIAPGMGFGLHPHANMEIITIPLSGAVAHQDSAGGKGVVSVGEVQVMSAGTGVHHSEFNASKSESLSLFQIWIEPATLNISPRYDQRKFDYHKQKGKFQLLVSPVPKEKNQGSVGELSIHQEAYISMGRFEIGQRFSYALHSTNHGVLLMVVVGEAEVTGQILKQRDALGISEAENISGVMNRAGELLLIEVPMS